MNLTKAIPNAKSVAMSRPSGHLINIHVPLKPSKPLCVTQLTSDHEPVCVSCIFYGINEHALL